MNWAESVRSRTVGGWAATHRDSSCGVVYTLVNLSWGETSVRKVFKMATVSRIVRVLVVEDFEPFRQLTRSMLGKRSDLQIICEVSDGLEAVRKAEKLKPDLILLDVGLPTLNGFEAARQIRTASPNSKIIFVTQEFVRPTWCRPLLLQERRGTL